MNCVTSGWMCHAVRDADVGGTVAGMEMPHVGLPDMSVPARAAGKAEEGKECGRHSASKEAGHEHRVHEVLIS